MKFDLKKTNRVPSRIFVASTNSFKFKQLIFIFEQNQRNMVDPPIHGFHCYNFGIATIFHPSQK